MLTKHAPRAVLDKLVDSQECWFPDEKEVEAPDYQRLRDGNWKSKKEHWESTHVKCTRTLEWSKGREGAGRQGGSYDSGYPESGCASFLIHLDHLHDNMLLTAPPTLQFSESCLFAESPIVKDRYL